jgi:hypothetical protein
MRKFIIYFSFCVLFLSAGTEARAQVGIVSAPILEAIQSSSKLENALYYLESLAQMVTNATNTYNQFQNMLRQEKMALDNLSRIGNVRDLDSFKDWYNRQLYLERQADDKFNSMNIRIGSNNYGLKDIADIPKAVREGYFDAEFWNNSLSEKEKKALWNKMGLSPANYAYIKVWEEREEKLGKEVVTKLEIINDENKKRAEERAAMAEKINADKDLPEDMKMGEKELAVMSLQLNMRTLEVLEDMRRDAAVNAELQYSQSMAGQKPPEQPVLSNNWNYDYYKGFSME